MTRPGVLVADDKENILSLFRSMLENNCDVTTIHDGAQALALALAEDFDVVVSDIRMPGCDGMALLYELKKTKPDVEVVLMTAYGEVDKAVEAMRAGAFDYITKPFEPENAVLTVARAAERRRLRLRAQGALAKAGLPTNLRDSDQSFDVVDAGRVDLRDLIAEIARSELTANIPSDLANLNYKEALDLARERASREYLVALMHEFGGSVTRAAERAGVERESLHRLLKRYGLRSNEFKVNE